MKARIAGVLLTISVLAACGSSSSPPATAPKSKTNQAETTMTQACLRFAKNILSTDPNSGIPQMTLDAATTDMDVTAKMAQTAANLDPQWEPGAKSLATVVDAMRRQNSTEMGTGVAKVNTTCRPLIAQVASSTTVP